MSTQHIYILFAHPALEKSRVNHVLIRSVETLEGITILDLYQAYPDFHIDVSREKQRVEAHDIIVFHHPLYWYSMPSLLREWQDLVLEHSWAYGNNGTALRGKKMLSVVTTGGGIEAYTRNAHTRFTLRELLAPIEQMTRLCRMDFLPPFVVYGTYRMTEDVIQRHADDYRRTMEALRDDRIDLESARKFPHLNSHLSKIIRS